MILFFVPPSFYMQVTKLLVEKKLLLANSVSFLLGFDYNNSTKK